jgi:hypothetical protein
MRERGALIKARSIVNQKLTDRADKVGNRNYWRDRKAR